MHPQNSRTWGYYSHRKWEELMFFSVCSLRRSKILKHSESNFSWLRNVQPLDIRLIEYLKLALSFPGFIQKGKGFILKQIPSTWFRDLPVLFALLTYVVSSQKLLLQVFEYLWRRFSFLCFCHQPLHALFLFLDVIFLAFTLPRDTLVTPGIPLAKK